MKTGILQINAEGFVQKNADIRIVMHSMGLVYTAVTIPRL